MLEGSGDSSPLSLQACVLCFAGVKRGGGALLGGGVPDLAKFATLFSLSWFSILSSYYILLTYVL